MESIKVRCFNNFFKELIIQEIMAKTVSCLIALLNVARINGDPTYTLPCQYCNVDTPCLTDDYIYGDYTCTSGIYYNGVYICGDGYTLCEYSEDKISTDVCSKKCNPKSVGKPCMDNIPTDNHCWDYESDGKCPYDTTDCGKKVWIYLYIQLIYHIL